MKIRGRDIGIAAVAFLIGSVVGGMAVLDTDAYEMGYDIGFGEGREFERDATPAEPIGALPMVALISGVVLILGLIVWHIPTTEREVEDDKS